MAAKPTSKVTSSGKKPIATNNQHAPKQTRPSNHDHAVIRPPSDNQNYKR